MKLSQFNIKFSSGMGVMGEAIHGIQTSVSSSHSFATSCFSLLPSQFPSIVDTYMKNVGINENRFTAMRKLYQISLDGVSICIHVTNERFHLRWDFCI